MKKILQISSLFLVTFFYGQQISDYQYIYVPEKFNDVKVNKYNLNDLLTLKLKQKNFTVITASKEKWPAALSQNPCQVLTAEVLNTSNLFKNRLKIEFKDCQNKIISSMDGKSSIKEFEPGMRDALEDAARTFPTSMPIAQTFSVQIEEPTKTTQPLESKNTQIISAPEKKLMAGQKAEIYSNGSVTVNRIFLANGAFILVNPNNSIPYATFKPSTKKEVYRVQLQDGTSTLGYLENREIIVELANSDGSFRKEVFSEK